jgi:hypothetical protein
MPNNHPNTSTISKEQAKNCGAIIRAALIDSRSIGRGASGCNSNMLHMGDIFASAMIIYFIPLQDINASIVCYPVILTDEKAAACRMPLLTATRRHN